MHHLSVGIISLKFLIQKRLHKNKNAYKIFNNLIANSGKVKNIFIVKLIYKKLERTILDSEYKLWLTFLEFFLIYKYLIIVFNIKTKLLIKTKPELKQKINFLFQKLLSVFLY